VRILIVEDDLASNKMMQAMLKPFGECVHAANGWEAINIFGTAVQNGRNFDLVCLDIMMPGVSGHEVLKNIRRIEEDLHIFPPNNAKIIMTSALSDKTNIMDAFINQCESYLVKPIEYEKLLEQMQLMGFEKSELFESC
jgi:two-component system chemotaxis response regulator CheY